MRRLRRWVHFEADWSGPFTTMWPGATVADVLAAYYRPRIQEMYGQRTLLLRLLERDK